MRHFTHAFILISLSLCITACTKGSSETTTMANPGGGTGTGGSMARFTIVGNYLYLADYSSINVYDISNPSASYKKGIVQVGMMVETIFPYKDKLFIGSRDGMLIYSIGSTGIPQKLGTALHVRSCDPVVANDTISYVTLRGGTNCGPATSGLYVYDIRNIMQPRQKAILELNAPQGLGLKDTVVFVCQGTEGLAAINVANSASPKLMYRKQDADYIDVIPYENLLICYVSTGLVLWDMSNLNNLVKLGEYKY